MADQVHPAAQHHLPAFITDPGGADVLMVVAAIILLAAVLGLLALFTHVHLFWIIGLLLALIDVPDFSGMFSRMAGALEKIAGIAPGRGGEAASDIEHGIAPPDDKPGPAPVVAAAPAGQH